MKLLITDILEPSKNINMFLCPFCRTEMKVPRSIDVTRFICENTICTHRFVISLQSDGFILHTAFDFIDHQISPFKRILVISRYQATNDPYANHLDLYDQVLCDPSEKSHTDISGIDTIRLRVPLIDFHYSKINEILNKIKTYLTYS